MNTMLLIFVPGDGKALISWMHLYDPFPDDTNIQAKEN
jgi:hypothetical protein